MDSLTVSFVNLVIDEALEGQEKRWQIDLKANGLFLRRSSTRSDWTGLAKPAGVPITTLFEEEQLSYQVPYFFGIGIYTSEQEATEPCGLVTFYLGYSTWDGRCLFIDRLDLPNPSDTNLEKVILRGLADITVRLNCGRLCWKVRDHSIGCLYIVILLVD